MISKFPGMHRRTFQFNNKQVCSVRVCGIRENVIFMVKGSGKYARDNWFRLNDTLSDGIEHSFVCGKFQGVWVFETVQQDSLKKSFNLMLHACAWHVAGSKQSGSFHCSHRFKHDFELATTSPATEKALVSCLLHAKLLKSPHFINPNGQI